MKKHKTISISEVQVIDNMLHPSAWPTQVSSMVYTLFFEPTGEQE